MDKAPNRIRELREERGWSLEELANRVNPPTVKTQIAKLEKGDRKLSDDWKRRLAVALGVAPWDLLPLDEQPPSLAPDEQALLELYRGLDERERAQFRAVANALAKPRSEDNEPKAGNGGG